MERFTRLEAVAVALPSANIDTDQVIPARYLQKPRGSDFGLYLFHDLRRAPSGDPRPDFPPNQRPYANARILVAGRNFGCGSSREQAVWALHDGGFRAVIAPSFGDIFFSNALKNGLLPVVLHDEQVAAIVERLHAQPGTALCVDLAQQSVSGSGLGPFAFTIDPFSRHCLLEGLDEIDYTFTQMAAIRAYEEGSRT